MSAVEDGDSKDRRDRELIELLNELRVALPGVQVLFAFLLTVPFSQRFVDLTGSQKVVYFLALLFASGASAFLIAPTAYHRIQFREGDKEKMLEFSNLFAVIGLILLALAISTAVTLITGFIFTGALVPVVVAANALLFVVLWFVVPAYRRNRA